MNKACYMCKHFDILTAQPDYSELTPGSSFDMYCLKSKWEFDPFTCTEEEYAKILETAQSCPNYEPADFVKKGGDSSDG